MEDNGKNGSPNGHQNAGSSNTVVNGAVPKDRFGNPVVSRQSVLSSAQYMSGGLRSIWFTQIQELPPFTFDVIRTMLFEPSIVMGLAMREAPICNAEFGYRDADKWVQGVYSANEEVSRFVYKLLHRLWTYEVHKMVNSQVWGWSGGEVVWQLKNDDEFGRKLVFFDQLEQARAQDISILKSKREGIVGISVGNTRSLDNKSKIRLESPGKGWFVAHKPEPGEVFGTSCLKGAYSPFADKWFDGGANDVRRLVMHKDGYAGMSIGYPLGSTPVEQDDGTVLDIPNIDIARKIQENVKSGGLITFPNVYDEQGKPKWIIEHAKNTVVPTHILEYPKDLDIQMMRGMEIPDEVVITEMTGAWQGKKVPMLAFYGNLRKFGLQILRGVVQSIIEPAIMLNFGKAYDFEVTLLPFDIQVMLTEQAMMPQGQPLGGADPQGGSEVMQGDPMEAMMGGGQDAASMMGPDYSMGGDSGGLEFNQQQMSAIARRDRVAEREALLESDRKVRKRGERNVAYVSKSMSTGKLVNATQQRAQKTIDRQLMMRGMVPYFNENLRDEICERRENSKKKDRTFLMSAGVLDAQSPANKVPGRTAGGSGWQPYSGPREGKGWQSTSDPADIRYQDEMPGTEKSPAKPGEQSSKDSQPEVVRKRDKKFASSGRVAAMEKMVSSVRIVSSDDLPDDFDLESAKEKFIEEYFEEHAGGFEFDEDNIDIDYFNDSVSSQRDGDSDYELTDDDREAVMREVIARFVKDVTIRDMILNRLDDEYPYRVAPASRFIEYVMEQSDVDISDDFRNDFNVINQTYLIDLEDVKRGKDDAWDEYVQEQRDKYVSEQKDNQRENFDEDLRDRAYRNFDENEARANWVRESRSIDEDEPPEDEPPEAWIPSEVIDVTDRGDMVFLFESSSGDKYIIDMVQNGDDTASMSFRNDSPSKSAYGITGSGSASEVMSKVVAASVALIREKKYNLISMTAKEPSRQKLYDRMVKGMASLLPDYMVVATGGQKKAVTGSNQSTNPSTSEAYFNAVDIAGEIQDEAESETRQKLFSTINAGIEERHRASGESMDGMTVIRDMNDFMSFWGIAKSSPAATPEIIEMVSSLPSMNRPPGFDAIEYLSVRAASMTDDQLRSVNLNRDGTRIPGFRIQPARIREYAIVRRELKDDYEEELASKPGKYEVLVMSTMRWKKRSRAVWRMGAWHDKIKTTRMSSWEQYTGPREGEGWKHKSTGEVRYQPDQPDDSEGIVNLGDKVLVEKIKPPKGDWDVDDKGQPDPSTTGQMTALKNSGWQYDFETGAWIEGTPEPKVLKKAPAPVVRSGGQDEDAYVQKMLHELKLTRNDLLKFHRAAGLSAHSLKTDEDLARSLWRNVAIHNQKRTVGSGDDLSVNTMKPAKGVIDRPVTKTRETQKESNEKFNVLMKSKTKNDRAAFKAARADGIAISPAWTEVVYHGKYKDIIAEGRDSKGRKQRAENPAYRQRISDENNARIAKDLTPKINAYRKQLRRDAYRGNEEAKVLYLIAMTGFRIGGKGDGKADVNAFGASTLQGQHVSVDGNFVTFDFPGKSGIRQVHTIKDKLIARMMRETQDGNVFSTNDDKVREAWKKYGGTKVHDLRHVIATEVAQRELEKTIPPMPKYLNEMKQIIKKIGIIVGKALGNTPAMAIATYIDPDIWKTLKVAI